MYEGTKRRIFTGDDSLRVAMAHMAMLIRRNAAAGLPMPYFKMTRPRAGRVILQASMVASRTELTRSR